MLRKLLLYSLLVVLTSGYAAEYKEFRFDTYPGWGEQRVLSSVRKGAGSLITLVPATAQAVDNPRGALYVYTSGVRTSANSADLPPLDVVAMLAVASVVNDERGCSVSLLKYRDELRDDIPHFHSQFYVECSEATPIVGALVATKVNGKVVVMFRPIALGKDSVAAKYNAKTDDLEFDASVTWARQELVVAVGYLASVGK